MLDVDGLKHINDAHGHAAGDAALIQIARRLHDALPSGQAATVAGSGATSSPSYSSTRQSRISRTCSRSRRTRSPNRSALGTSRSRSRHLPVWLD